MNILYFDCFAGASGNMILGGLVALGLDPAALTDKVRGLDISDFEIEFATVNKCGISSCHAVTKFEEEETHRHLSDIESIIESSPLSEWVKQNSISIFTRLAEAEARIHGTTTNKVHFHEVGAMDAIIDVVGACIGFEMLGIEKFACSKIHVGSGFVEIAHGKYPVPPPAVVELLERVPIYSTDIKGELITPTGAAIISTLCDHFGSVPEMNVVKTGYGAGTRDYKDFPNALRMILGKGISSERDFAKDEVNTEVLSLIETNLDDVSPEILGFVMERAFEIGALDCWFTPIQMKKNRPATMISILTNENIAGSLTDLLYSETSTLGVRISRIERQCLPRYTKKVETEYGTADVKIATYDGKIVNAKPEFEWLRKVAKEKNVPVRELEELVLKKLKEI